MRNERGYRGGGGKGKGVGRGRGGKRGSGRGQGIGQGKVGSRRMGRCQGVTPMAGLALDASLSRDAAQVTVQLPISLERHRSEQKPREQGTDEDRSGVYFDVNKHRTAVGNAVIEAECRCPYVSERLPPQQALVLKAQTQDTRSQLSTITHRIAEIEATGPDSSVSLERPSTMISNREKRFLKMTAIIDRERCIFCERCVDICPEQAISMNDTVTIDAIKCTGCGSCVNECPNDAISLSDTQQPATL